MKIKTRKWTDKDIPILADIERLTFAAPWSEQMLAEEYGNKFFECIIAEIDDKIAGYINYHIIADEYHIANLAVRENFKKQGVATNLLAYLIDMAIKNKSYGITLEVRQSNEAAIGLYSKFGFIKEGKRIKYYGNEDAVIMWKYL